MLSRTRRASDVAAHDARVPSRSSRMKRTSAAGGLLVHRHELEIAVGRERGPGDRQPGARDAARRTRSASARREHARRAPRAPPPSPCRRRPPRRAAIRRSPAPASIAWPKVWPKLSSARTAGLALVRARPPAALISQRAPHRVRQRVRVAREQPRRCSPRARRRTPHRGSKPCLITSASPARSSRSGSVSSAVDVGEHRERLVERADHVLAARVVDRGLAADRGVDLGEQRGRHLDERDAALIGRRGETGEIADHAAAERDDQRVAVAAVPRAARRRRGRASPSLLCLLAVLDERPRRGCDARAAPAPRSTRSR